jgi:hypothetical protein
MPDYSKGKIYKLTTPLSDEVYYGSTIQLLSKRKGAHKGAFNAGNFKCKSSKLFELSINDVEITLVENINCNSKEELLQRERFYIDNNNCINKNNPIRTNKDEQEYKNKWYQQNKERIIEKTKQYNEDNKNNYKQYQKEWRQQNKNKCNEYIKEYYEENKNHFKQYKKEWYQQNKERLKEKRNKE